MKNSILRISFDSRSDKYEVTPGVPSEGRELDTVYTSDEYGSELYFVLVECEDNRNSIQDGKTLIEEFINKDDSLDAPYGRDAYGIPYTLEDVKSSIDDAAYHASREEV